MYEGQKNGFVFWRYKKHVLSIIQTLKKTRKAIVAEYDNDALHDFRVAVRKLLSLNNLFEKTVGFCFDEELKKELKSALSISSQLRDTEELLNFAPELKGEMDAQRAAYLDELIAALDDSKLEKKVSCGYEGLHETMREQSGKLPNIREAALEAVIESMKKTSKKYAKIADEEKVDFVRLHFVRKRCKRYRYQLDFLFLGGNEGSLICKRIQDKLGKVNDLRVWLEMVEEGGSVSDKIATMLGSALQEARVEASLFASKDYCDSLATELRRRMSICE